MFLFSVLSVVYFVGVFFSGGVYEWIFVNEGTLYG